MRRRFAIVLVVAAVVPRCTCAPPCSNHSAPHATFDVAQGCVGYHCAMICDPGFADCNGSDADGCETSTNVTNGTIAMNTPDFGASTCSVTCNTGAFDCDGIVENGCESTTPCKLDASTDSGEPKAAHVIADLLGAPHGLVACAGHEFFMDGFDLISIDTTTLATFQVATSSAEPAGGLACDGAYVYWGTVSPSDASASGFVVRAPVQGGAEQMFASGLAPSAGIDVRDGGAYVMNGANVSLALGQDAGVVAWMPASQAGAYKPFALGSGEDWSISGASILMRTPDASATTWLADAGTPRAIFLGASGDPLVVSQASDAGDLLARVRDDAGAPTFTPFDGGVHPVVATSSGSPAVVASDDAIYVVGTAAATQIFSSTDHIVDVAIDGTWVVWTTRTPARVWRGALP
jgi:hypothetical protein